MMTPATPPLPLTIVVPVYNRAHCLARTLDSIAAQTLRPLRLIIVDNNSTDTSLQEAGRWADAHRSASFIIDILSEPRPGAAAARQRGLDAVESPWTMFFDSDDTMEPTLAADIIATARTDPRVDLIGWDMARELPGGRIHVDRFVTRNILWNQIIHSNLSTLHYAARTDLFRRAGGWDASVRVWDDLELGVRLLLLRPRVGRLRSTTSRPPVNISYTPRSITTDSDNPLQGGSAKEHALDLIEASLRRAGLPRMTRWIDLRRAELAAEYRRAGSRAEARRLLSDIVSRRGPWYRLIYHKHRLYPRGTYLLLPPPRH